MIVADDGRIAALCESMRNEGRGEAGVQLAHERLGYNYRIDEVSAALGVVQMGGRIDEVLEKRARVAQMWHERLSKIEGVWLPHGAPEVDFMSWFVYVTRVGCEETTPEARQAVRHRVMQRFQEAGNGCRPYFTPMHLQPFYLEQLGYKEGDFPVTEAAGRTSVAIPLHHRITEDEVEHVAEVLERALGERARLSMG